MRDNFPQKIFIYNISQCGYPSDWSMECFLEYIIPKEIMRIPKKIMNNLTNIYENSYFN